MNGNLAPRTETSGGLLIKLIGLGLIGGIFFHWLLQFWGVVIFFVVLAITTEYYTETVAGYRAHILLDQWKGTQRTVFQGWWFKLPWETLTQDIDLKGELKEVLTETYSSRDGSMDVKYVYTIRPDFFGPDGGEKIILYASFETDVIKMKGRACASQALSDYFGTKPTEELLDKHKIEEEALKSGSKGKLKLEEFEKHYGARIEITLEDSDRDKATQAARDTVSKAKSIAEAKAALVATGMDPAVADKTVRMLNIPGIQEYIVNLDAKGLENLTSVVIGGGLGVKK